jgi:hypothetical protein
LQPINLHYYKGHELREPVDVNPANAANPPTESFLQDTYQNYTSDIDSGDFSVSGVNPGADPVASPGAQSSAPTFPTRFDSGSAENPARVAASRPGVVGHPCVARVDAPDIAASSHAPDGTHMHASAGGPHVARDAGLSATPSTSPGSSVDTASAPGAHTGFAMPLFSGLPTDLHAESISRSSLGSPADVAAPTILPARPRTRLQICFSKSKKFTDTSQTYL